MAHRIDQTSSGGPQSKTAILSRRSLQPLVVSIPEAAAMIGVCQNIAREVFAERAIPVIAIGKTRRGVRVTDLEKLLDELAREAG